MLAYVTLGTDDLASAGRFYDATLAPLGYARLSTSGNEIGYGHAGGKARLYVTLPFNKAPASFGNGTDVAFEAASRPAVDAFHAAALAAGGTDEGAPDLRPHYHADFYTAYVRDLSGNKLNAVCEAPFA